IQSLSIDEGKSCFEVGQRNRCWLCPVFGLVAFMPLHYFVLFTFFSKDIFYLSLNSTLELLSLSHTPHLRSLSLSLSLSLSSCSTLVRRSCSNYSKFKSELKRSSSCCGGYTRAK